MRSILSSLILFFSPMIPNSIGIWANIEEKTWITQDIGFGSSLVFYATSNDEKKALLSFGGSGVQSISIYCYDVTVGEEAIELRSSNTLNSPIPYLKLKYDSSSFLLSSDSITFKVLFEESVIYKPANERINLKQLKEGVLNPCNLN
jgi:hypothetical protein